MNFAFVFFFSFSLSVSLFNLNSFYYQLFVDECINVFKLYVHTLGNVDGYQKNGNISKKTISFFCRESRALKLFYLLSIFSNNVRISMNELYVNPAVSNHLPPPPPSSFVKLYKNYYETFNKPRFIIEFLTGMKWTHKKNRAGKQRIRFYFYILLFCFVGPMRYIGPEFFCFYFFGEIIFSLPYSKAITIFITMNWEEKKCNSTIHNRTMIYDWCKIQK